MELMGSVQEAPFDIVAFFADRLKVQQREAGVRHDLIDAVFALGGEDDLVRLLARVHALQAFVTTEDGTNLLAGYKRAANILKKEGWDQTQPFVSSEVETPCRASPPGRTMSRRPTASRLRSEANARKSCPTHPNQPRRR